MKGGVRISNKPKRDTQKLFHALLDGVSDFTKTAEYRKYAVNRNLFTYPPDVMAQIKEHNPNFTAVTTEDAWRKNFKRYIKNGCEPFSVKTPRNPNVWLLDVSQTSGTDMPVIYSNISGKVTHYPQVLDCLANYSDRSIHIQEGTIYYSGVSQDSFIENNKIIVRSGLSEQQIIFALVREIIRQHQPSTIVAEAASYMVCRHLGIDTSIFTFGYLLEQMNFDEGLKALKETLTQDTIIKEAESFIGFLNTHLSFLQSASGDEMVLEIEVKQDAASDPETTPPPEQPKKDVETKVETIHGIEFHITKIIKEFLSVLPDKSITPQMIKEYGYFDENMLVLGNAVAIKLFSSRREIYLLRKDNTEVRAESLDDINCHYGLFGIKKVDWEAMQVEIAKNSLAGERVKINRWGQVATKEVAPKKGGRRIAENKGRGNTGTNVDEIDPKDVPTLDESGNVCIMDDDISNNDVENHEWIQPALALLFDNNRYRQKDVPFFVKQGDFEPSSEMKKINKVMTLYAAVAIPDVLNSSVDVSPDGKRKCNPLKAARTMCKTFNTEHISNALEVYWQKLNIPIWIKGKFNDYFHHLKSNPNIQTIRSTPDESIQRVTTTSGDNAAEQDEQDQISNKELELIHIMDSYKKKYKAKPKETPKVKSPVPSLSTIKPKAR